MKKLRNCNLKLSAAVMAALSYLFIVSGCYSSSSTLIPVPSMTASAEEEAPQVTPTPFIARINIEPSVKLQTLVDVGGGNFIHRYGGALEGLEPVSQLNIEMLEPNTARVSIDLDQWEPQNDNGDPFQANLTAFHDVPGSSLHATFDFLQQFEQMGPDQILIGSVWHVPGWMVENPDDESSLVIPEEMIPEAIESISTWVNHAKNVYGVEIDYVSFNEANLGVRVFLTGEDYIRFIQQAGPRFADLGITAKWLLADASNMGESTSYARSIYSDPGIHAYLGPFSYHSWDYTASDKTLEAISQFALENQLEVWCTEGGWNPSLWQMPREFPTWRNALNQATTYSRLIKLTHATRLLYWEMVGGDYSLNDGTQPYPILSFMAEFKNQFPPGAQVVQTSQDYSNLKFVAALSESSVNDKAGFSLLIVNRFPKSERVVIQGLPVGNYTLLRSSQSETNRPIWSQDLNGESLELEIAASSINFLSTRKP
jgi:O-glycosyl hydrolase